MSIVKRQHYVWRHYLRAWAQNDKIPTYFTVLKKTEIVGLMGVAQERYFYELIDLTIDEETFIKNYINERSPEIVKSLNIDFLKLFTSTSRLKRALDKNLKNINKEAYEEEIRKLEINIMEIAHGKIENLGNHLIACQNLEDLKLLEEQDLLNASIMFLCFQYFRTKKMRNAVIESFKGDKYEDLAIKSWNIFSYILATNLTKNIALDRNIKFLFHVNHTTEDFITSDQPIFNILNDQIDENGDVKELEFYYPISPSKALSILFRETDEQKFSENNITLSVVEYFNRKVIENSDFYIFSQSKNQLEKFIADNLI